MLTGRPIAASDIPVFREMASDSGVLYFDEHDPLELAQRIANALSQPHVRLQNNNGPAERVEKLYSSKVMARNYINLYIRCLSRRT